MNYNDAARAHLNYVHIFKFEMTTTGSTKSAVSIATRYGLDAPGVEGRWGETFRAIRPGPLGKPTSCTMCTELFPGGKVGGA